MTTILPAILANTIEEAQEKLAMVLHLASMVQIDISDGIFTPSTLLYDPRYIHSLHTTLMLDLHLMIKSPEQELEEWVKDARVKRITFHKEACDDSERMIARIKEHGKEACIACNPETQLHDIEPYLASADMVLCLGVHPGKGGQTFIPEVLEKVELLRAWGSPVGIDGGVNADTAPDMVHAGAGYLVVGNFLFNNPHMRHAYEWLESL